MAGDEHDSGTGREVRQSSLEYADLGVSVERHRIVGGHPRLHSARGIHDENVETAPLGRNGIEHRRDGRGISQIGAHRDRLTPRGRNVGDEPVGSSLLIAEVDDHAGTGGREIFRGVGADAARRARDEHASIREGSRLEMGGWRRGGLGSCWSVGHGNRHYQSTAQLVRCR